MKKDIHPVYHTNTAVTCSCGHSFTTGSTVKSIAVEVCSNCHPFYTGTQKLVDTAGRVDRFKKRLSSAEKAHSSADSKKKKRRRGKRSQDSGVSLTKAR